MTPADADLRDFQFTPVEGGRLFGSEFHARSSDGEWRAGVTLWLKAWHQVPAASLPNDDVALARLAELGRDQRAWKRVREGALWGWVLCSDGRLYHPVVAEKALESWLGKLTQRVSSGFGNAKRTETTFDPTALEQQIQFASDLLMSIAPGSKALAKSKRRTSQREPGGNPSGSRRDGDGQ